MSHSDYHHTRLAYDNKRSILWKTLYDSFFSKFISPDFCVLDLGAGYGDFINNVKCRKRIAVDLWEDFPQYINEGVTSIVGDISCLDFLEDHTVDFVFASNVFEHITQEEFIKVLSILKQKLKHTGTINIIQPNFKYAFREYFDDYTHKSIYTDTGISDLLEANGYHIIQSIPKFLPLTIKSKLPVIPLLIKAYLLAPVKPMGKQMFIRAESRR